MGEPWNEASYNLLCFSKCVYSIGIDVMSTLVVRSRIHVRSLSSEQILSPNIPLISVTIIARKLSFGVCVCVLRVWEGDYVRSYLLIIAL